MEETRVGCIGCTRVYVIRGKDTALVKDDDFECRVCHYLLDAVTSIELEFPERVGEIPHCKTCTCGNFFKRHPHYLNQE